MLYVHCIVLLWWLLFFSHGVKHDRAHKPNFFRSTSIVASSNFFYCLLGFISMLVKELWGILEGGGYDYRITAPRAHSLDPMDRASHKVWYDGHVGFSNRSTATNILLFIPIGSHQLAQCSLFVSCPLRSVQQGHFISEPHGWANYGLCKWLPGHCDTAVW